MSFILAHEWVLPAEPSAVRRTAFVLHGVLGSGQNFRGLAKALVRRRPDYALVLVDLRNHGSSTGAPAPHTLAACAQDLVVLSHHLEQVRPELPRVSSLIGHSFGGKVAVAASTLPSFSDLAQVFVLDSNPGAFTPSNDYEVLKVIRAVRAVPQPILSRAAVVESLRAQGLSAGLANWMTTNVRREDTDGNSRYVWTFDLDAIEESLRDYFVQDYWDYLDSARAHPEFHLVVAENSDRFSPQLRERAASLSEGAHVLTHLIPKAGHWLHVDNPEALLALFEERLG